MKQKILVCDDEAEILDITELILDDAGFEVIKVQNSLEAIDQIKTKQPDLILLDLWMPGMSGDQIVAVLRQDKAIKHIPVIIISASPDGKEKAFTAGANHFIAKPYDLDDLIGEVVRHVN